MLFFKITLVSLASISNVIAISVQVSQPTAVTSKSQPQISNYPSEISTHFQPPPEIQSPHQISDRRESEPDYYALRQSKILLRIPQIIPNDQEYDFYFPQPVDANVKYDAKDAYLQEMQPPSIEQEPNYYVEKPKKGTKKYSPDKKHVNVKNDFKVKKDKKVVITPDSFPVREYAYEDYINLGSSTSYVTRRPDRLTPKTVMKLMRQDDLNTGEYLPSGNRKTDQDRVGDERPPQHAEKDERVEFQMHGFNGPNSYKFGYDTERIDNSELNKEIKMET